MSREYFSDINTISHRQAADFARTWLRKAMAHVVLISPAQTKPASSLALSVPARKTTFDDPKVATMGASPKALFPDGRFVWRKLANGVEVFDRSTFHMGNPTPLREFDEIEKVSASELGAIGNVCRQNAVLQVRTNRSVQDRSAVRLAN